MAGLQVFVEMCGMVYSEVSKFLLLDVRNGKFGSFIVENKNWQVANFKVSKFPVFQVAHRLPHTSPPALTRVRRVTPPRHKTCSGNVRVLDKVTTEMSGEN